MTHFPDGSDEGGEILMGCWDCGSCGAQRLRGDAYQCASCGAPRPDDVKFYLPGDAEVIKDQEGIRAAEAGPDWQCAFCQSWMPATESSCRNCQASAAESERRQKTRKYQEDRVPPVVRDLPPVRRPSPSREVQRLADPAPLPPPRPSRRSCLPIPVLMVIALLGIAAVIYGMNRAARRRAYQAKVADHQALVAAAQARYGQAEAKLNEAAGRLEAAEQEAARARDAVTSASHSLRQLQQTRQDVEDATAVNVLAHGWNVQLQIEQCGAKQGEGWTHPPDAFDVSSEQRVHHHQRVLDHVETLFRTETYRAQDGFDTETYTERVSTGTRQVPDGFDVEDLGNGRFRRTQRYRSETVYENVTKTRQKPRMVTKTRQIPYQNEVYRQDPVNQPWYTYHTKVWTPAPPMSRAGEGMEVLDPADRPPQDPGNELGARRVRDRQVTYSLTLQPVAGDSPPRTLAVPEARWRAFADGSSGLLARNELLSKDERQTRLVMLRDQIDQTTTLIGQLEAKVPPLEQRIDPLQQQLQPLALVAAKAQEELGAAKQALEAVIAEGY